MPENVDACAKSIMDDNPDMDESTAYAICNDMDNKGVLSAWLDADPEPDDGRRLAQFRNPQEIRRTEGSGNAVTYKRVMLLSPGQWADAGSKEFVDYNPEAIRRSAENFVDLDAIRTRVPEWPHLDNAERAARLNELGEAVMADGEIPVNFLHGPAMYGAESFDEIGSIPTESVIVDDDGRLYGDITLHGESPQSLTAIDLMDEVLEAAEAGDRDPPPVGPSVEIPADDVTHEDGAIRLQEAWFSATGIVFSPASRPVELGEQARERAVAMTAADGEAAGMVYRAAEGGGVSKPERLQRVRALRARVERLRDAV